MPQNGVIILAHGSRGERGKVEVPEVLRRVTDRVKPLLPPEVAVIGAALQFNHPNLEEAVASLVAQGVGWIVIMPYFLFPGRHITEDIPEFIEKCAYRYPEVKFVVANTLGDDELFTGLVAERIEEAAPELWRNTRLSPPSPEAIEQQSLEIVARLLPPNLKFSEAEWLVVKRVVHASGDPQIAGLMRFGRSAVRCGLSAISEGSPIFTDVNMVAVGINRDRAEACGCSVSCALDVPRGRQVKAAQSTRAAAAMHNLGKRLDSAIVAIGNAPTALLALLELIDSDGIKPALVVGMPVGFVRAKESKDELMKRDVPYITIVGTRGGSAMAAAAVNALLKMAVARNEHSSLNLENTREGGLLEC